VSGDTGRTAGSVEQVERWARDVCRDLGLQVESGSDDFFAAGGTSLTVIRFLGRAEAEFGEECLPPDDLYDHSSLHDIAVAIVRNRSAARESADPGTARPHGV
jgi:Phosphopantetheine attachment site